MRMSARGWEVDANRSRLAVSETLPTHELGPRSQGKKPPFFLITIDTEGDNLWSAPTQVTTRNAEFLWRFQDFCQDFAFRPTYLVNYEMAMCPAFRAFGRDVLMRKTAEIGMHLHAWNAPPIAPLTDNDHGYCPFLFEYPDSVMRSKVGYQTNLLADVFGAAPVSHRSGRWALDRRYVELLIDFGYKVDCSVTPGLSWKGRSTAPAGSQRADYRGFPDSPYWIDPSEIGRPGSSALLEVPMTVLPGFNWDRLPPRSLGATLESLSRQRRILRPTRRNLPHLFRIVRRVLAGGRTYAEFMLHSSEFMPGGSPSFPTKEHIERLYSDLRSLFSTIALNFTGATLTEFYEWYLNPT